MPSETLYNGIELPDVWPPRDQDIRTSQPMNVPYLRQRPAVVPIDVGRQLFVDDFLVEKMSTIRVNHRPRKEVSNPLMRPETPWERNSEMPPCVVPKCGGIWYDPRGGVENPGRGCFRMWYMASYLGAQCYAESDDGLHWRRPNLDIVPGTNLVLPRDFRPDSGTVWLDHFATDEQSRYKAMIREPNPPGKGCFPGWIMTSPDGLHWSDRTETGPMDDRSTMFYNPFRRKWVQSIRHWGARERCRNYWEHEDFHQSARWGRGEPPFWVNADCFDEPGATPAQLYNLDAVAYESLMISPFQILKGPPNHFGEAVGLPKLTELCLATSRDGFHWNRQDRRPFIGARREPGSWEYGYVESTGGVCLIVGDELWFYYSAYGGDPTRITKFWQTNGTYANGALGLARLRRDGFSSLRGGIPGAEVTTRPVRFSGDKLFVNVNTLGDANSVAEAAASLQVEVLDLDGKVIAPFDRTASVAVCGDHCCVRLVWEGAESLAALSGQAVRFRFILGKGVDLYAFWVTDSALGRSHGHLAAGGPGLPANGIDE